MIHYSPMVFLDLWMVHSHGLAFASCYGKTQQFTWNWVKNTECTCTQLFRSCTSYPTCHVKHFSTNSNTTHHFKIHQNIVNTKNTNFKTKFLIYDIDERLIVGDPIFVSTLSSHCNGPFKWSSIQQGVEVTVWRRYSAPQPFTKDMRMVHILVSW